jgi:D-alanyl-D-alanine carboxypeptidase-like protein
MRGAFISLVAFVVLAAPASAEPVLDALVAAYPDHLVSHDETSVLWKDGTRMSIVDNPGIVEQFLIPYTLGMHGPVPRVNEDPGRVRDDAFFRKMYGDCRKGEVDPHLKRIVWLPGHGNRKITVTNVNGIADRLEAVARDLAALPPEMTKYLVPSAGGYSCRRIRGGGRVSMHAYAAAIDLNPRFGNYWIWTKQSTSAGTFTWINRIPLEIVEVFERHGFIWGGKWYRYDTFHFEYRPEIVALAQQGVAARPSVDRPPVPLP